MPRNVKPASRAQLPLFPDDPAAASPAGAPRRTSRNAPITPAPVPEHVRELARQLPHTLRMGTSSWSFPGWDGLVYSGTFTAERLAKHGLSPYAQHPLLRTVGVDRTHYAPVGAQILAAYASQVPDDFRFLVKAHELCTLSRYPTHPRYGRHGDQDNPLFLDPAYAADKVVAPLVEGLGPKAGPLLFQFAPQPIERLGGTPARFAERLHAFLAALPAGPLYAVEVRNRQLLGPIYAQALADVGACHCVNIMGNMPPALVQWNLATVPNAPPPALVARWMLAPHLNYDQARVRYAPFNAIVDPNPRACQSLAHLLRAATAAGVPTYVIANNKAEGSAPLSLVRLAGEIAGSTQVPF